MTMEAVVLKMLDIYVSNLLIGLGWMTAIALVFKVATRGDR